MGFDATTKETGRAGRQATKAFKEDGTWAYAVTGATLEHPVPTLTGRIRDDIAFVDGTIGVGEISVSELGYAYDSNGPGAQYIAEAATAGLLAGRLAPRAAISACRCRPTSAAASSRSSRCSRAPACRSPAAALAVNQTDAYMADAIAWAKHGGYVDVGANYSPENNFSRATPPAKVIARLLAAGVPLERIL